ncbi:hypothetical protein EXIGLDRAFT_762452 [Exidia glandulosa HHB12029]|uniref:Uncharacterized protein n=1 Tax=Exidia glandulosa HHB12029 TaxID=1314781 RepID=A0A166NFC4_EXIGL|nr:hypothetical protein EXIGLDRAFT_707765 [Exidia glandulosa HHB12029]KZV79097.1 hypothetical protein EXIGLDRAFT_757206 [Exidia glandulosa HHB12029]KZV99573.1 hypothetical protein EXIGLDRAFT_762452 [Exidia glandulosa HHB12029]
MLPLFSTQQVEEDTTAPGSVKPYSFVEQEYINHARAYARMPSPVKVRVYLILLSKFLDAFDAVNVAESKLEVASLYTSGGGKSSPELPFAEKEVKCSRKELRRAYRMFSEAGQF